MTITYEQLVNAQNNASKLKNLRDFDILESMAKNLKKWGSLTSGQAQFAKSLIERNSDEKANSIDEKRDNHRIRWQEDGAYREWVLFLAKFFIASKQRAYQHHIENRRFAARSVLMASRDLDGSVPNLFACERLTSSKLAPRLRDTFDNPPIYPLGELVQVRASELDWVDTRNGLDKEMGFIVEVNATPVVSVATYNKAKGGTRTYKVMFPSGEHVYRENQIKLVSRKNRGKK